MSYSVSINRPPESRQDFRPSRWVRVAFQVQTYRNILYLLASFPLGTFYFVALIAGLSAGLGSVIAVVGIPLLLLTVLAWWWMAAFERQLAIWWLGVAIPPMYRQRPAGLSPGRWLKAHLGSSVTWTSLLYLLAKFPLGVLSFIIAMLLTALTSRLVFAPLPYLVDAALGQGTSGNGLTLSLILTAIGIGVGLVSMHLLNGLALVSGRFARLMLGQSDMATRLSETQKVAERATAQAAQADQKRHELIVNVSHELRTPIASIRGHVDSLLITLDRPADATEPVAPPAELRKYLGIISRETDRLGTLVDELLSLARAESGELRIDLAPVAAGEVVDEVWTSIAPLAKRDRQITVVRDVAPDLPPVIADRQRLTQVVLNLVRNATTYTPAGGIVSISLRPDGPDRVALVVADTGIGIAQEDLDRIFDRFYRTDASRARTSGGFGLGLAIVRDLVTAMGGTIAVDSTVGEGSTFTVTLAVAPARGASAEPVQPAPGKPVVAKEPQQEPSGGVVPW